MIRRILLKNNVGDGDFVYNLAEFFYSTNQGNGEGFKSNTRTSLNYFGEYLERHDDRDVSMFEVMAATCLYNMDTELPKQQIFDGQYEMFVERVEQKREEGFDFELDVLYSMFLYKMKKQELGKEVLKNALINMRFDSCILGLCELIKYKYISLDKECKRIITDRLINEKISIDIEGLMNSVEFKNYNLRFASEHAHLKYLFDVLDFKKSDFKSNPEIFESLKNLKKIGTRDCLYEKIKNVLDVKEDEFYFLSLKIASDWYADGSALVKTNNYLIEKLEEVISPNNRWSSKLPYLRVRVKGGTDNGQISLSKVKYDDIEEKYYKDMIFAYYINYSRIDYEQIKNVCHRESFVSYMNERKDNLTYIDKTFIMKVIQKDEDRNIIEEFYNIIKDYKDLNNSDICDFCRAKLVDPIYILDKVFETDGDKIAIEYSARDIINGCRYSDLYDILLEIVNKLNGNKVKINSNVMSSIENVSAYFESKFYSEDLTENARRDLIFKINDFNFLYLSKKYHAFLIRNMEKELFRDVLNIDDDELKEVANYLLSEKSYMLEKDQIVNLKKIVLSDNDMFEEDLKIKINEYISRYILFNGAISVDKYLVDFIKGYSNKTFVTEFFKKFISNINSECKKDMEFMAIIRLIIITDLFEEYEIMNFIKDRLFVAVM